MQKSRRLPLARAIFFYRPANAATWRLGKIPVLRYAHARREIPPPLLNLPFGAGADFAQLVLAVDSGWVREIAPNSRGMTRNMYINYVLRPSRNGFLGQSFLIFFPKFSRIGAANLRPLGEGRPLARGQQ